MPEYFHRICVFMFAVIILMAVSGPQTTFAQKTDGDALSVKNCSGTEIRIVALDQVPTKPANTFESRIAPGITGLLKNRASHVSLKIYEADMFDTLRVSTPQLANGTGYSAVRLSNGQWQLVAGTAC